TIATNPSGSAEEGAEVTLTITPANGYQLVANSLKAHKTGDEATTVTITDGKFIMPAFNVTVKCEFELITGIDNNTTATVSAYPNPFTDYMVVESEEQIRSVEFINIIGKTVQHVSMPQAQISTQNLLPGIYLVKVDFAKGKPVVIRMVKQ
ncbi:MAG: T9SS type A sorting domain-containing protein, partial [Bacteroidales bacterium]|nr:T9SS type A sorting domain-containing protein [Bacteroidales bacterium]MBN2748736.1 T9SS type A sorting domain-containing protein [Bacteroidales bacterium]